MGWGALAALQKLCSNPNTEWRVICFQWFTMSIEWPHAICPHVARCFQLRPSLGTKWSSMCYGLTSQKKRSTAKCLRFVDRPKLLEMESLMP